MGETISKRLEEERYSFPDSYTHEVNWWEKNAYIIDRIEVAQEAVSYLNRHEIIYVDCEGENFGSTVARIGVIQIAVTPYDFFLFDVASCPGMYTLLKKLMESETVHKVFHDCSGDVAALDRNGIQVNNIGDTQVAQKLIDDVEVEYSLSNLYKCVMNKPFPKINVKNSHPNKWLQERPLTQNMVKYAVSHVMVLPEIYEWQMKNIRNKAKYNERVNEKKNYKRKWVDSGIPSELCTRNSPGRRTSSQQSTEDLPGLGTVLAVGAVAAAGVGLLSFLSSRNRERR